jgi:predicted RNA-binding protein with PUA-like domain
LTASVGAEGVRNYKARNILRAMRPGQLCFFYHSNCKTPGIVGIMEITAAAYPDHTQFDANSKYFDPKSSATDPKWSMVDVQLVCPQQAGGYCQYWSSLAAGVGGRLSIQSLRSSE